MTYNSYDLLGLLASGTHTLQPGESQGLIGMEKKLNKCKAAGCSKWVSQGLDSEFCDEHRSQLDPISALYVDKTPEQLEADERIIQFFCYLLQNKSLQELMR